MFPITISFTINSEDEFNKLNAALGRAPLNPNFKWPTPSEAVGNAQSAATPTPADTPSTAAAPAAPAEKAETSAPALDYDTLKKKFINGYIAKLGREKGIALLKQFGIPEGKTLKDLPQDKWQAFFDECNKGLAS